MERIIAELENTNRKFYVKVVLTTLVYVTVYGIVWYYYEAYFSFALALTTTWTMTPLILYLDRKGAHKFSRLLFIFACMLYILTAPLGIRDHIDIAYYFLASVMLPALLFEPKEKGYIILGILICFSGWVYFSWGPLPDIPKQWMPVSLPVSDLRRVNFIGAFLILGIFTKFFVERYFASINELNQFFDVVLDLLCIAGPEGKFKKINPAFSDLLGYSEKELKSKPFIEFVHPDDVDKTIAIFDKIKAGEPTFKFENRYRRRDGSYLIMSWSAASDPLTKNVYASARDITVVRQHELELRQVFDAIERSSLVATANIEGRITSVNENFCRVSGFSRAELLGQDHKIIKSGIHSKEFIQNLWDTILSGRVWYGEIQNKTKEGLPFFVQTVISPMSDIMGRVQKFLSIQFDMTKQKESEQLLEEAQSVAKIGSWSFDAKAQNIFWSKKIYDFFPRSLDMGPPNLAELEAYIHPDDQILWRTTVGDALQNGNSYKFRFRTIFPDGKILWLEAIGRSRFDSSGKLIGLTGTCQDISDIVVAEEQVKIERAKAMQSSKLASLGEMSAGIAHEINNPLAIITGAVWRMDQFAKDPEKLKARVETIEKAAERIEKIVKGLRKFSRSYEKSEYKDCSLSAIVNEALILTEAKSIRHSTQVIVDIKAEGAIWCDEIEIEQVLINLINNGIDAAKDQAEKWVRVELTENDTSVNLRVSDSGKGIPNEVQKKLFQPFFTTKAVGEGTGLGLSIVKGILDEHDATIEVLPDLPYTCFEVKFTKKRRIHAA